jgi:hypothetical protein
MGATAISPDIQALSNIIDIASTSGMVSGTPGQWSVSAPAAPAGILYAAAAPVIPTADGQLVQNAVDKSNNAAATTPAAASGTPVTSSTPPDKVTQVLTDLNVIGHIGDDLSAMEAHGVATLHWWGWEAKFDEPGTQALAHLLGTDMTQLSAVLAALSAISPVFAAVGGILGIVAGALAGEVNSADNGHNGVVMKGYLWVGIAVDAA